MKKQSIENQRMYAQQRYDNARSNLMLMIVFTLINMLLLIFKVNMVMLFSATVPYILMGVAVMSGVKSLFIICLSVSVISVSMYFLCWLFSKEKVGWMAAALVLFLVDTALLVYLSVVAGDTSVVLDFVIHIWVLYYLINGVRYGYKLKKLPTEEEAEQECAETASVYAADMSVKSRVLARTEYNGYSICYRRVRRTNELVINGYVYDSVEMFLEHSHTLTAEVDGHIIEAGLDDISKSSFIRFDGTMLVKKMRLW